ncbi:MAG: DUF3800 domain-containing protein [bacterium]
MSYLLFIDESGNDRQESPYEVLAGICFEDRDLWNLVCQVQDAEYRYFGRRVTAGLLELKAKKLLKHKTYRLASEVDDLAEDERTALARRCLEQGEARRGVQGGGGATYRELAALAQAKIAYVSHILELCLSIRGAAFASIVAPHAPRPQADFLRKDYSYLFERFFYFIESQSGENIGLVIFDELERVQCHILLDQMSHYFRQTLKGRTRSAKVIPEPFFVHSHLTTAIQLADLIAYIISWGVRFGPMNQPYRTELAPLAKQVMALRRKMEIQGDDGQNHLLWTFTVIDNLRPREEIREEEMKQC